MSSQKKKFIPLEEIPVKPSPAYIEQIEDVSSRIKDLERKIVNIEDSAEKAQKRIESTSNFVMWVVGVIALGFIFLTIQVSLDYFRNNEERYEKFIEKTEEIKNDFYTKEQLEVPLKNADRTTIFLDCLKAKGYFSVHCFQ